MDNAAKAIIIAAGFFIGIMIITLFMYMLTSFRSFQSASDFAKENLEINSFNNMFNEYIYAQSGDSGTTIRGYQLYNLLGLVAELNSKSDNMFYVSINGSSFNSTAIRDNYFYYTDRLNDTFNIAKVEYSNGVINNIVIADKAGRTISF